MKRRIIARIVIWSLVAVFSICALGFGLADEQLSFGFISAYYEDSEDYSVAQGRAEISKHISNIEINWMNGIVSVDTHSGDYIIISEHGATDEDSRMRFLVRGSTLTIQSRKSERFMFDNPEEKTLVVLIPQAMAENLTELSIESLSGSIKIANIKSERLFIESVDAEISVSEVVSRHLDVETVNADAEISGTFESIDAESVSGNVIIKNSVCPSISSDFVSGELKIYVPRESSFTASVDSVSGRFSTEFDFTRRMNGYVVNGGEKSFDFETISGDVFVGLLSE